MVRKYAYVYFYALYINIWLQLYNRDAYLSHKWCNQSTNSCKSTASPHAQGSDFCRKNLNHKNKYMCWTTVCLKVFLMQNWFIPLVCKQKQLDILQRWRLLQWRWISSELPCKSKQTNKEKSVSAMPQASKCTFAVVVSQSNLTSQCKHTRAEYTKKTWKNKSPCFSFCQGNQLQTGLLKGLKKTTNKTKKC